MNTQQEQPHNSQEGQWQGFQEFCQSSSAVKINKTQNQPSNQLSLISQLNSKQLPTNKQSQSPSKSIGKKKTQFKKQVCLTIRHKSPIKEKCEDKNAVKQKKQQYCRETRFQRIPIMRREEDYRTTYNLVYRNFAPRSSQTYFRTLKEVDYSAVASTTKFKSANSKVETYQLHFKVNDNQFDLYMRVDTNTNGHRQWFFYSVRNNKAGTVKFNIMSFKKKFSLFQRGMKPFVCSVKSGGKWVPGGTNVKYRVQKRLSQYNKSQSKHYYLSFEYKFEHSEDEVYFSAGIPYTYSFLQKRLSDFQNSTTLNRIHEKKIIFKVQEIGKSMCGLEIPFLTLEPNTKEEKKYIVVSARTHPGEFSSSWVMDGFLQKLINTPQIHQWMTENSVGFRIIPMVNPDGVFLGNYRTGIVGDDFNRKFSSGKKQLYPEIFYIKKIINDCKKMGKVYLYLDLHGHSILRNSFIYGPVQTLFATNPLRNLAFTLWHSSKFFQFSSCKFRFQKDLTQTARVYFQLRQNILTYTLQTSLGLYGKGAKSSQMKQQNYQELGSQIIESISELMIKSKFDKQVCMPPINNCSRQRKDTQKTDKKSREDQKARNKQRFFSKSFINRRKSELEAFEKSQQATLQKLKKIPKASGQKSRKERSNEKRQQKKSLTSIQNATISKFNQKMQHHQDMKLQAIEERQAPCQKLPSFSVTNNKFNNKFPKREKIIKRNDRHQGSVNFTIRKKSDGLKSTTESHRQKQQKISQSSSKLMKNDIDLEDFQYERSITYDTAYLSSQFQNNQKQSPTKVQEQIENDLDIIDEKFSEQYSSINDSDSLSEDLQPQKKEYLIQCIGNNRRLKTNINDNFDSEQAEQYSPEPHTSSHLNNINRFKEIQFKSLQPKNKNIQAIKPSKRDPHKFRDMTHKSLNRSIYEEQTTIMTNMVQKKQLNERMSKKGQKEQYFLTQIKNKYN